MTKSSFSSWAAGLLLLGTLLFAGTVAAQEPAIGELTRKGEEAYLAKKYKTAVEYFTTAAEQGDAQAQYRLGECYYFKRGVKRNYKKAVDWCEKAAEEGIGGAQYILGACYYDGKGVEKNLEKAFFWYRKAAYQDLAEAQYFLGMCYYSGEGVEQDNTQSAHWLHKALENGLDGDRGTLARDMIRRIERPSSTLR